MNNPAPRKVSVSMSHNGKPISAAAPGSTIVLELQIQDVCSPPLRYSWTSESAKLSAADAALITMKLPATPQETVVFVEITNDTGGALNGSIAIPLAASSSPRHAP